MVSALISRMVILIFGLLYPAYTSYKAVKTKNVRDYVRWMMYWIVFALFMAVETFTDQLIACYFQDLQDAELPFNRGGGDLQHFEEKAAKKEHWFPFYYEIKMAFVIWLLSPYTKGASLLYRKFIHPALSSREKEIDAYIIQAKERSYETMVNFGRRGLNIAATAAVQAASKGQGALVGRLRSFSMQDLRSMPDDAPIHYRDPLYPDVDDLRRRPLGYDGAPARHSGQESDSMDEHWSDSEVMDARNTARARDTATSKPLSRSQSLRVSKKKPLIREGSLRVTKVRSRKKLPQLDQDS